MQRGPFFTNNQPGAAYNPYGDNLAQVYEPSRVYYKNMSESPQILASGFKKFQVFVYAKGSGVRPDATETWLVNSKKYAAYLILPGKEFDTFGNFETHPNGGWVIDYA